MARALALSIRLIQAEVNYRCRAFFDPDHPKCRPYYLYYPWATGFGEETLSSVTRTLGDKGSCSQNSTPVLWSGGLHAHDAQHPNLVGQKPFGGEGFPSSNRRLATAQRDFCDDFIFRYFCDSLLISANEGQTKASTSSTWSICSLHPSSMGLHDLTDDAKPDASSRGSCGKKGDKNSIKIHRCESWSGI